MSTAVFTGERLPAVEPEFAVDRERHLAAYRFAAMHASGRTVLDVGCGEGYGAALLAEVARRVLAVDRPEATRAAAERYRRPALEFRTLDVTRLATVEERFELVVSFQVIEHLPDPSGFLADLAGCCAPGGLVIVTTPNRLMSVSENPYHLREWTAPELLALALPVLPTVRMLGVIGSERVLAYERARGDAVARILRLDPLGLRRLLPAAVVERVFPRLARLVRRRLGAGGTLPEVTAADFGVREESVERALDLVLVARG